MSALFAVLLLVCVVALLERTHRRAHALDHAPGRPTSVDDDRVRAELAVVPHPADSTAAATRWSWPVAPQPGVRRRGAGSRGEGSRGAGSRGARRPGAAA